MDAEYTEVGGIRLLDGEEVCLTLDGRYGLLQGAPPQDDFIVVTNQRLICFARKDGKHRRVLLPIDSVESVEVTDLAKSIRPLVSGGLMLLAAVGVSWTAAVLGWGGILPWIIGAVLVALGALTASSYFVSEDSPSITFRARTTEVSLALRGEAALRDAYLVANGPFQVQAAQQSRTGKDDATRVVPWWSRPRTAPSVAASLADEEGERPVEPLSGGPSTADDAPSDVAASVADEEGERPVEPLSGGPSTADDAPSDVAASLADEEGERPVEPLSGDPSTADDAPSDVAASVADEEGERPVEPLSGGPSTADEAPSDVAATVADEEGERPVEPLSGDLSTADDAPPDVAASLAGEEGDKSLAPLVGDPSTTDDPAIEGSPRSAESQGRHDI